MNNHKISAHGDTLTTRTRIGVLDVARGLAIILIFFFNIPNMGNSNYEHFGAVQLLGWCSSDQVCWWILTLFVQGTQRGLLQILFGAGALILLEKTIKPSGPLEPVDRYFRRNLWLIVFGLLDIFVLLWFGDILLAYALAALLLFPFRKLSARSLLLLSLLFTFGSVAAGISTYLHSVRQNATFLQASQREAIGEPLTSVEIAAVTADREAMARLHPDERDLALERRARLGPFRADVALCYETWFTFLWHGGGLFDEVVESFFTMLLGMAFYKWGITQGLRSRRFYALLALLSYAVGLTGRVIATWQQAEFQNLPNIGTFANEPTRLLVTIGHLALLNLIMTFPFGRRLLGPFKAPGRVAFTLYLLQNFLGDWVLFPGFGFGLFGRFGWTGLTVIVLIASVVQVVLANLWLEYFALGPLEWLWRSLTQKQLLPLRSIRNGIQAVSL